VSHWTCNETSGVRYDSEATTTNDLTDVNTVGSVSGLNGNACNFVRASSERLDITNTDQIGLSPSGSFAISTWYKPASTPSAGQYTTLVSKGGFSVTPSNTVTEYLMYYRNDGNIVIGGFIRGTGVNKSVEYVTTLSTSQTYHIVLRFEASKSLCIWLNNSRVACNTTSIPASVVSTSRNFSLGADNASTPTNYLNGTLEHTTFLNYLLPTTSIATLYNSGVPLDYDAPVSDVTTCIYANMCTMNDVIGQTCVTDGATTTCSYQNSPTTTPVEVSSDNIILALSVIVFFVATIWVGFMFLPFRKN